MLRDRFEDPRDDGTVPAIVCLPKPKRRRRHRVKAIGLSVGIRVPRASSAKPPSASSIPTAGNGLWPRSDRSSVNNHKDLKLIWGRIANSHFMRACTSRPVRKDEIAREKHAQKAEAKEWDSLRLKEVWDSSTVRDFNEIARAARRNNVKVHLGRVFGIMVEKGAELPKGDERRKYKYSFAFQGNNVIDQNLETAIFHDLGSSPASMEAGKMADAYGSFPNHEVPNLSLGS